MRESTAEASIPIVMTSQGRHEAHRRKPVLLNGLLKVFILEAVSVGRIAIKIEDNRWLLDSLGLKHVKVERITPSPLH
jgi:hypothetical protein